jgi:hypothetical protein
VQRVLGGTYIGSNRWLRLFGGRDTLNASVQARFLFTAQWRRLHFDLVLWKLISKVQTFSQRIQNVDGAILLVHRLG